MVESKASKEHEVSNYRAATNFLCDQFDDRIVDGEFHFSEHTFADTMGYQLPGIEWVADGGDVAHYVVAEPMAGMLIQLARDDYWFYDLCVEICVCNIDSMTDLPNALRYFVIEVLNGKWIRPKKRGVERKKNWLREAFLHTAVTYVVQEFDLPLTRNDVSQEISACDAIAEALTVCSYAASYTKIKNLMVHPDKETFRKEKALVDRLRNESRSRVGDSDWLRPENSHLLSFLSHSIKFDIVSIRAAKRKKDRGK